MIINNECYVSIEVAKQLKKVNQNYPNYNALNNLSSENIKDLSFYCNINGGLYAPILTLTLRW